MHLYDIDWRYIVDWVVIASCFVTVLTIVIDLIKSAKSNKNLSKEHERLEEEHKDINNSIAKNADVIRSRADTLTNNLHSNASALSQKADTILQKANDIDKMLYAEYQRNDLQHKELSDKQKNIKEYVTAISDLMKELQKTNYENKLLVSENQKLLHENQELHRENEQLKRQISMHNQFDNGMHFNL